MRAEQCGQATLGCCVAGTNSTLIGWGIWSRLPQVAQLTVWPERLPSLLNWVEQCGHWTICIVSTPFDQLVIRLRRDHGPSVKLGSVQKPRAWSLAPETTRRPSGAMATQLTESACSVKQAN